MKIIFLDIDGVLNSRRYDLCRGADEGNIDISRLPLIKELTARTGAEIVLTSSWRSHWNPEGGQSDAVGKELEETFLHHGITLYDKTPEINNDRVKEIGSWLETHPGVTRFVIIDDMKFGWGNFEPNVVKTDYYIGRGLNTQHIEAAYKILSEK